MINKYYGVVYYSVIIFLLFSFSVESTAASRALVRFTYKFHSELSLPRYQEAFQHRLSAELNLVCRGYSLTEFAFHAEHPSKIIKRINDIFQDRAGLCADGNKNLSRINELTDLSSRISNFTGDRFVLFASESSVRVESSLGHIAILYQDPANLFFSPTIMFSADSFYELEGKESLLTYYLKGGLSHLDGRLSVNYFFDHYSDLVKADGRNIEKYRLVGSVSNSLKSFDRDIIENLDKTQSYNFFSKNCSTHLLNLLLEAEDEEFRLGGFESPARHLDRLIKSGHLEYESTLNSTSKKLGFSYVDRDYLKNSTIYPSQIAVLSDSERSKVEFTVYSTSRPVYGAQTRYYDSKVASLTLFPDQSHVDVTLVEKNAIHSYPHGGTSSFLNLGYRSSIDAHYYRGIGFFRSNLGAAISIGCDINRGCGTLTAVVFHKGEHEITATLKSDREGNLLKFNYFFQINPRFRAFFRHESKSTWIGGGVRF